MQRLLTIIYVIFCLELGIFLFFLPWSSLWAKNFFVDHYSLVSFISGNYFLRGAISGLGLADIWLAAYEISHFRRSSQTSGSQPAK
jgi:hypothetical protein